MRADKQDTLEKYYCMQCKSSQWMRLDNDKTTKMKDTPAWICIICGTAHSHPHLWKKPPKTIQ